MRNLEFLVFVLLLFCGVVAGHMALQATLGQDPVLIKQLAQNERAQREANLRADLAEDRLADFQNQVATLLPAVGAGGASGPVSKHGADQPRQKTAKALGESYPIRQLASVVTAQKDLQIERGSSLLDKGKAEFRDGEFERSNLVFADLIELYPESVHVAEAHFLLAEGQFKAKDYEAAIATIEKMITLFPENELTGFALLRLGRIYEIQDRLEDASDIYKSILANFKEPQLQKQAAVSLKSVKL